MGAFARWSCLVLSLPVLVAGCASSAGNGGVDASARSRSSTSTVSIGLQVGGDHKWSFPSVTYPGPPVRIVGGAGADPLTEFGTRYIRHGQGAPVHDRSRERIRAIVQSWDGRVILHNTWKASSAAEALPPTLSGLIFGETQGLPAGSVVEILIPQEDSPSGITGSTVLLIDIDTA